MSKLYFYFNVLMIAIYAIMSIFLIFAHQIELLPLPQQKWLGGVLLIYAVYRTVVLYKKKNIKGEE
ncbi:MAG: hypothetical protein HS118_02875 [Bacteroidia bacterium]|nr:hypothetical protein [Bacteroidia bacterium]